MLITKQLLFIKEFSLFHIVIYFYMCIIIVILYLKFICLLEIKYCKTFLCFIHRKQFCYYFSSHIMRWNRATKMYFFLLRLGILGIRAKSYLNRIYIEITKLFLEHVLSSPALKREEFISLYIERIQWTVLKCDSTILNAGKMLKYQKFYASSSLMHPLYKMQAECWVWQYSTFCNINTSIAHNAQLKLKIICNV